MTVVIYNETINATIFSPGTVIQYTYGDILQLYSQSFLNQMLLLSTISFLFNLYVAYYVAGWHVVSYNDILQGKCTIDELKDKIISSGAFICLLTSSMYPLIIIGQMTGWF